MTSDDRPSVKGKDVNRMLMIIDIWAPKAVSSATLYFFILQTLLSRDA